jgi:hypothetical protein
VQSIVHINIWFGLSIRAQHMGEDVDIRDLGMAPGVLFDQAVGRPDFVDLRPAGRVGSDRDVIDLSLRQTRPDLGHQLLKVREHLCRRFAGVDVIAASIDHDALRPVREDNQISIMNRVDEL